MINNSLVYYEHSKPFSNLTIFDYINLEAIGDYATQSLDIPFHIKISVTAMIPGGIDRFIGSDKVTVEEGGNANIGKRNLNTSGVLEFLNSHRRQGGSVPFRPPYLRLMLWKLPQHGVIVIGGKKVRVGDTFSQSDVDRGFVTYRHDHSDSMTDDYGMSVYLQGDKSEVYGDGRGLTGDMLLYKGIFNISILPLNDQKFKLITPSPSMTVVQRQSRIITRDMLATEDPDSDPRDIIYDIINAPVHGRLVFTENLTRNVNRFSQEDINNERLLYWHDGSRNPVEFYFRVSDGMFTPVYRHFRIIVIPLELKVVNQSVIEIQQGTRMAYITSGTLS